MERVLNIILLLLMAPAMAQETRPQETRPISDAELKAFHTFYQQQFPNDHSGKPQFARGPADGLVATIDSPPQRGLRALCRMKRSGFVYDGKWRLEDRQRQFVWLDARACRVPSRPVELLHLMPDADVLGLLEHQGALLKSARLLFAGNTGCAKQRAFNFTLAKVDIGTSGSSPEVLAGLVFKSDRNTTATVWARRRGVDYDAWNVDCG